MRVRWVRSVIGFAVLAAAAPAHGDEISDAKKLLRSGNPHDRSEAIVRLVAADSKRAVTPLEDAIRRSRKDMDRLAIQADAFDRTWVEWQRAIRSGQFARARGLERQMELAAETWPAVAERLVAHLAVITDAGDAMARFRSKGAVRQIEKGARSERDPMIRQMYVNALGASGRRDGVPTLLSQLRDGDSRVRAVAARALRSFALDKEVVDALVRLGGDKHWAPRLQSYESLARAPFDVAVPTLIEAAQREDGQIAAAIDALLLSLTGQSFANSPESWRVWWADHGPAVEDGSFEPDPPREHDSSNTVATFFSIPIVSKNVMFVVDHSGSMHQPMSIPGEWANKLRNKYKLPETALGYARTELIRAIQGLPKDANFNIVLYDNRAYRFSKKSVRASKSAKSRALKWVLQKDLGEATNCWDALRESFADHLEDSAGKLRFKDLPDTIVFLSDGEPTRGRFLDSASLVQMVRHWNLAAGAVIHTIGLGDAHEREFLLALARDTHGSYLDLSLGEQGFVRHIRRVRSDDKGPHLGRRLAAARQALASDDFNAKLEAIAQIQALGGWGVPALDGIAKALGDADSDVGQAAQDALIAIGPQAVAPTLPYLEHEDEDLLLRAVLVFRGLGRKGTAAVPYLIPLLGREGDEIQHAAIEALGRMGSAAAEAAPTLEAACATDNEETRRLAKQALERIGQ